MLDDIFGGSDDMGDEGRQLKPLNEASIVPPDIPVSVSDSSNDGDCVRNVLTPCSITKDVEDLDVTVLYNKEKSCVVNNDAKYICDTDSRDSSRSFFLKKIEGMENCKKDETIDSKEMKNIVGKSCRAEASITDASAQDCKYNLRIVDSKTMVTSGKIDTKVKRVDKYTRLKNDKQSHAKVKSEKTSVVKSKMKNSMLNSGRQRKENSANQKSILSFFKENIKIEEISIMTDFSSEDETSCVHRSENCCLNCEKNVSTQGQINNTRTMVCDNKMKILKDNVEHQITEGDGYVVNEGECTVQKQGTCHVTTGACHVTTGTCHVTTGTCHVTTGGRIENSGRKMTPPTNLTPTFHIESVYSFADGGFFPDDDFDNTLTEMEDTLELGKSPPGHTTFEGSASVCVEINEVRSESVNNKTTSIKRSATDILMAASRSLSNKGKSLSMSGADEGLSATDSGGNGTRGGWKRRKQGTASATSVPGVAETEEQNYKRKCPFYKKIPGTSFTVDAFRYGEIADCKAYILSHFHYDHYGGLTKGFRQPIYCSQITGNLVTTKIRVDKRYINTVPLNTPTVIEGVQVTFLEANHCPGAVLILFQLKSGRTHLHTGDFRASTAMEDYPALQNLRVHTLYLDTTYCDPQYVFPEQEKVIAFGVQLAVEARTRNPKTLLVCGSYTIGKERIFTAIAEKLDCKIAVTRDKKSVLECLEDEALRRRITLSWADSGLHVLPMNKLNYKGLQEHLQKNAPRYNCVLGLEPTGWTYNSRSPRLESIKPKLSRDCITVYGIPYSEHSSFLEMKRFVQFTRPEKILATVNNGNVHSRTKMDTIFEAWMEEVRRKK